MNNFAFDNEYRKQGYVYLVGVDEAGRGPLAGPVVAAAVILPPRFNNSRINDSKTLTPNQLIELAQLIKENAQSYALAVIDPPMIDQINIYQASKIAMEQAINALTHAYDFVLSDAMKLDGLTTGYEPLVKGDAKSLSIAAASILAKVHRDELMMKLDKLYPQYGFKTHKGYPTKKHLETLKTYGPIQGVHRFTYKPVRDLVEVQINLF